MSSTPAAVEIVTARGKATEFLNPKFLCGICFFCCCYYFKNLVSESVRAVFSDSAHQSTTTAFATRLMYMSGPTFFHSQLRLADVLLTVRNIGVTIYREHQLTPKVALGRYVYCGTCCTGTATSSTR